MEEEPEMFKMRQNYYVYSEKNLKVMHVVRTKSIWGFKYPKEIGVPSFVKRESVKTIELGLKVVASGSQPTNSPQLDSVITYVQQLQNRIIEM